MTNPDESPFGERYEILDQRTKRLKREMIEMAIDETLPIFADQDPDIAREIAERTLEEIQQGENPDLEERFRAKIEELGIKLES